jgi:hypothetical protein
MFHSLPVRRTAPSQSDSAQETFSQKVFTSAFFTSALGSAMLCEDSAQRAANMAPAPENEPTVTLINGEGLQMRVTARSVTRTIIVVALALLSAVVIGLASTITSALTLSATALIVPGTGTPNANGVRAYLSNARDYYMGTTPCNNSTNCPNSSLTGINYPASFWPIPLPGWCRSGPGGCEKWDVSVGEGVQNLNSELTTQLNNTSQPVVIFGYSQGAAVVSNEIRYNIPNLSQDMKNRLSAVVIGNIDRPNGGLWTRFGFLGHIPILDATLGLPTPTNTITTTDIAFQYDGVADFPLYPIDLLADLNALAGFAYVHPTYLDPNGNSMSTALPDGYTKAQLLDQMNPALHPENFQYYNKTTYILIPTPNLPILQPLRDLGLTPIADLVQPVMKVLIDLGYNRSINPGIYTPAQLIPVIDPFKLVLDLATAIPAGIAAALADLGATVTPPVAPIIAPKTATSLSTTTPSTLAAATAVGTPTATTTATAPVTTSLSKPTVAASTRLSTPVTAQAVIAPPTAKTDPATADTNGAGGAKTTTSTGSPPSTATVPTPSKPTTTTGGTTTTAGATTSSGTSTGAGASTATGSTGKASSTRTGSTGGASSGAAAA